jgi:SRSO17 transposase
MANSIIRETLQSANKKLEHMAFQISWLRLHQLIETKNASPADRWTALFDFQAEAKKLAITRLEQLYPDLSRFHTQIATIAAESTQTWRFLRIDSHKDAANYIRQNIADLVRTVRKMEGQING